MATHETVRRVMHAPDDVYALVADVRDYPAFIPWIQAMRVSRERVEEGVGELLAEAIVGYKFVRERFATTVSLHAPKRAIDVAFADGPFTALENRWRFDELADGSTRVDFWINYQFRNPVLQALVHANFSRAVNALVGAFERRAHQRFPTVGDSAADAAALLASAKRAAE